MVRHILRLELARVRPTLDRHLPPRRLIWLLACATLGAALDLRAVQADAGSAVPPDATGPSGPRPGQPAARLSEVPLSFEPNRGQAAPRFEFVARGLGYSIALSRSEVVLQLASGAESPALASGLAPRVARPDRLTMRMVGADPRAKLVGADRRAGLVNYFVGNDPQRWRAGIPTYGKVGVSRVYPGVDLVFYGNQRELEYDFVVAPGADPGRIAWQVDGAAPVVDADGGLLLSTSSGTVRFRRPVLYQGEGAERTLVAGGFAVAGDQVSFAVGAYDHRKPLVIDPLLSYESYLGGSSSDQIGYEHSAYPTGVGWTSQGLAVDGAGCSYLAGTTSSLDFPVSGAFQSAISKYLGVVWPVAFVTKFAADGKSLVYSTYLGGSYLDYGVAIAVDAAGSAYVTGYTDSPDFPITAGAYQTVCGATYTNPSVHLSNCAAPGSNGNYSAFVTKLGPTGGALVYSTFLGGSGAVTAAAIAVDGSGRAYVAGYGTTPCSDTEPAFMCYPTTSGAVISGAQPVSAQYALVSVLDAAGASLLYSTLYGDLNALGSPVASPAHGDTYPSAIAVDSSGNFYLVGTTRAVKLPTTAGALQPSPALRTDAFAGYSYTYKGFVAKFGPVGASGSSLLYATYLGATADYFQVVPSGVAVDAAGAAYVGGVNRAPGYPVTGGAYQTACHPYSLGSCGSAFITKLKADGSAILWSTLLGGARSDADDTVASETGPLVLDAGGNTYLTGLGMSAFPQVNPVQQTTGGYGQVFVSKVDPTGGHLLFSSLVGSGGTSGTQSPAGLAVDGSSHVYLAGNTTATGLPVTPSAFQVAFGGGGQDGFVAKISLQAPTTTALALSATAVTAGQEVALTATVTGASATPVPTGTVTFLDGTSQLGTGTLGAGGTATWTISSPAAGTHSLAAAYGGDDWYTPSSSDTQALTVTAAPQSGGSKKGGCGQGGVDACGLLALGAVALARRGARHGRRPEA